MRKSEIPSWYSQLVEQGKVRKMQVYLTNYWTVCREARNFFELQEKRTETQCRGTGYRCSTCPLVFGYWLLSHVMYLKLGKKELLAKLIKFTK